MPYIRKEDRIKLDNEIELLMTTINDLFDGEKSGVLNYVITRLLTNAFQLHSNTRYHNINGAVGVLECAKLEMYRRVAEPYEDKKIIENGDVKEYSEFIQRQFPHD